MKKYNWYYISRGECIKIVWQIILVNEPANTRIGKNIKKPNKIKKQLQKGNKDGFRFIN